MMTVPVYFFSATANDSHRAAVNTPGAPAIARSRDEVIIMMTSVRMYGAEFHRYATAPEERFCPCKATPSEPTPPNRSDANKQRIGLQRAKITRATAINPWPDEIDSFHEPG